MRAGPINPRPPHRAAAPSPRPAPRAARLPAPARTRTGRRPTSRIGPARCDTYTRRTAAHRDQLLVRTPGQMHTHPAYGGSGWIRASSSRHAAAAGPGVLGCLARDRADVHVARSVSMASAPRHCGTQLVKHAFSMADSARRAQPGGRQPPVHRGCPALVRRRAAAIRPEPAPKCMVPRIPFSGGRTRPHPPGLLRTEMYLTPIGFKMAGHTMDPTRAEHEQTACEQAV